MGSAAEGSDGAVGSAAIVGTGLMGTSVALALRRHGVRTHLIDDSHDAVATASWLGAGHPGVPDDPVDIAILAVPPRSIAAELHRCQRTELARVYTDVGSVKGAPIAAMREMGCRMDTFVGGHPIVGSERSGPAAADADLFIDRTWVLTPTSESRCDVVEFVRRTVHLCGARTLVMSAASHDRVLARTSHVPHLISSVLAATLSTADEATLRLCGAGITDATRIAAGDDDLWTDILCANADEVEAVIDEITMSMAAAKAALTTDPAALATVLRSGNAGRAALMRARRCNDTDQDRHPTRS